MLNKFVIDTTQLKQSYEAEYNYRLQQNMKHKIFVESHCEKCINYQAIGSICHYDNSIITYYGDCDFFERQDEEDIHFYGKRFKK